MRSTSASTPIRNTKKPAAWWLYSDHAYSSGCRRASVSSIGAAAASSSATGGEVSRGIAGRKRAATSAGVARSVTTSTEGGREVSEAAASSRVMPMPTSASMKAGTRAATAAAPRSPPPRRSSAEVEAAQDHRAGEQRDLGEHHHPVAGPDEPAPRAHVAPREHDPRPQHEHEGGDGHAREAREHAHARGLRGGAAGPAPEQGEAHQVDEAAHPRDRAPLVEHRHHHERRALVETARGVGEPRRVHHQEHAEGHRDRPAARPRRPAPGAVDREHQEQGQPHAREAGHPEVGGEELAERPPAGLVGQRPGVDDQQQERGGGGHHQRARLDQADGAVTRGPREAARAGAGPQHQEHVCEAAHRRRQPHRPEASQQDVEKPRQLRHAYRAGPTVKRSAPSVMWPSTASTRYRST